MVFANSLSIHDLPRELALYFRNTINSLSLPRIHSELPIFKTKFTINSRSFLWIHFELAICFANAFFIHFLFRELTLLTSYLMRIHYLLIHYLWCKYTFSIYEKITINSLSFPWKFYEITIFYATSLSIGDIFREYTMISLFFRNFTRNSLYISRIHYESDKTKFFINGKFMPK